jgi:hypothetical protein
MDLADLLQSKFVKENGFPPDDPRCYARIPLATRADLDSWIKTACPVGGFLEAVLNNNLKETVNMGDLDNLRAIPAIVAYLFNRAPMACWGSRENFNSWHDNKNNPMKG